MADIESIDIRVTDRDQTIKLGEIIGKSLEPGSIIALIGDLGAGKTVLVKGIAKGLGIEDEPASPTFVIMNSYEGHLPLYHFDLYRITDENELLGIGYEEFFFGRGVSAVEWADRVEGIFPEHTIYVEITIPEDGNEGIETAREINIKGKKEWVLSFKNTVERALPTSTR